MTPHAHPSPPARTRLAPLLAAVLLGAAAPVCAQPAATPPVDPRAPHPAHALVPGAEVRVAAPTLFAPPRRGRLVAIRGDSLVIVTSRPADVRTLAPDQIAALEVRSSRPSRWAGAGRGAFVGFVGSATAATVVYATRDADGGFADAMLLVGLTASVTGATALGALIGTRFPAHTWKPVNPQRAFVVEPSACGVGLAVRF